MNTSLTTETNSGLSIFDGGSFEQMGLIASKLAQSSLVPDTLKGDSNEQTAANCFRVVEQAQRWGLSPFAVMDCASVVHGKLMWEGKLISAAVKASLGVRLRYHYEGAGNARKVTVTGEIDGREETIEGTVADWKTTGKMSPWDNLANRDQMLAYRGARQWARRHAPEVILGVYAPDEFDEADLRQASGRVVEDDQPAANPFGKISKDPQEEVKTEEPVTKERPEGKLIAATLMETRTNKGTKKNGSSYTRYGFRFSLGDGEFWAGTFSKTLGSLGFADAADVLIIVEKKGDNHDLLWIEEAPAVEGGVV
jgi:hypothetical protein